MHTVTAVIINRFSVRSRQFVLGTD